MRHRPEDWGCPGRDSQLGQGGLNAATDNTRTMGMAAFLPRERKPELGFTEGRVSLNPPPGWGAHSTSPACGQEEALA